MIDLCDNSELPSGPPNSSMHKDANAVYTNVKKGYQLLVLRVGFLA